MQSIQEIKNYIKKAGITYQQLSNTSGIPLNTLKNIFRGKTKNPRVDTMQAIERALGLNTEVPPTEQLTQDEKELLTAYRVLSSSMRAYVLQIVKIAVSSQETTSNNKNNIKKFGG